MMPASRCPLPFTCQIPVHLRNFRLSLPQSPLAVCFVVGATLLLSLQSAVATAQTLPNIVIIFADDLAYADVNVSAEAGYQTPNLDRMAKEGRRFTDFYVAQAVCSASRMALLTGCYPNRVGLQGALGPNNKHGIHADEVTLAEGLQQKGYATAIYGKWHLGHHPQFLPLNHGFDDYFGLPYSNDMWPHHPTGGANYPPLPLIEGQKVIELNPDQTQLTTWYTERAVRFIESHRDQPFFLYLPHSMPHVPLFVSNKFAGQSQRGLFGDVISEIDWSVGQVLETLKRLGLDEKTLVIFTSDNGPWLSYGDHAGSAAPLREGKGTAWDGGVRVPCLARWPGKISPGSVCRQPWMTIDILPTLFQLVGVAQPRHKIDGKNALSLLLGDPESPTPHEALFFYWGNELHAVRSGRWKLHFPHAYRTLTGAPGTNGQPGPYHQGRTELALYDLEEDPSESHNVVAAHPDVVRLMTASAEKARQDLGDSLQKRIGRGVREPGRLAVHP